MKAARNIFVNILVLEKELWNSQNELDTSSAGVRDKGGESFVMGAAVM